MTLYKTSEKLSKESAKMYFHKCVDRAGIDLHNEYSFVSINKDKKRCIQGNPTNATLFESYEIVPKKECDNK